MLADGWRERDREAERVRLALVSAGINPDQEPAQEPEEWSGDPADDAGVDFDYSDVDWDEASTASEWDRMQAALANSRMQVSDPEVAMEAPVVPDVDFDREWT